MPLPVRQEGSEGLESLLLIHAIHGYIKDANSIRSYVGAHAFLSWITICTAAMAYRAAVSVRSTV